MRLIVASKDATEKANKAEYIPNWPLKWLSKEMFSLNLDILSQKSTGNLQATSICYPLDGP